MLTELFLGNDGGRAVVEQVQPGFHFEDAAGGFLHALFAELTLAQSFFQPVEILDRIGKQVGIAAVFDIGPRLVFRLDAGTDPDHGSGIGNQNTLETELMTKQVDLKFAAERGGERFVRDLARVGRQRDMPGHDAHHAGIDHCLPDFAVEFHPLIERQRIDAGDHVLVAVVHAVSGKMLAACRHQPVLLQALDHAEQVRQDPVRIVPEGTDVGDRIVRIQIQVGNR